MSKWHGDISRALNSYNLLFRKTKLNIDVIETHQYRPHLFSH